MKNLSLLLISFILFSCSNNKNSSMKYIKHNIEFLNLNISIPENYISISFDDYKTLVKQNFTDSIYIASKISQINKLKSNFQVYEMFCDKNDFKIM